jgi:hypothetical protein
MPCSDRPSRCTCRIDYVSGRGVIRTDRECVEHGDDANRRRYEELLDVDERTGH